MKRCIPLLSTSAVFLNLAACLTLAAGLPDAAAAQDAATRVVRLVPSTDEVQVEVGARVAFTVTAVDANGAEVDVPLRVSGPRNAVSVRNGFVEGLAQGEYEIIAMLVVAAGTGVQPITVSVPVTVAWPAIARITIEGGASALFGGTTITHDVTASHADGSMRPDPAVVWSSSNSSVASVDPFGNVTGGEPGAATITASFGGQDASVEYSVAGLPDVSLTLEGGPTEARTGDVVHFEAVVRDASGSLRDDIPVSWSHSYTATEGMLGVPATGQINERGSYVADVPGIHTVMATAGGVSARHSFRALPRDVVQELDIVTHGGEDWYRTTDLWAFEGMDGRDYVVTGSKVSGGFAFFYDVTNPAAVTKIDSIQVDARTVNDVKVSPDGRYAVLSREGATNRRNGLVVVDMSEPSAPKIASIYEDGITGGVHNMFAAERLPVCPVQRRQVRHHRHEPTSTTRSYVSEYNHPDSRLHDVWVHDGIWRTRRSGARASSWSMSAMAAGEDRPENPVFVTNVLDALGIGRTQPSRTFQESTGKTYLFLGDEIMNTDADSPGPGTRGPWDRTQSQYDAETGTGGIPLVTRGYIQIVDFTDPENPGNGRPLRGAGIRHPQHVGRG